MTCAMLPLGGGNEIGASCYAVHMGNARILLDAGIRFHGVSRFPNLYPLFQCWNMDGLWEFDCAVISHAHLDHIGALPVLLDEMGDIPVRATPATVDLMRAQYEDLNEGFPALTSDILQGKQDISFAADRLMPTPFGVSFRIQDVRATLLPAGHIPGAAMTLLENGERRVLYTGDFCGFDQHTVRGAHVPRIKVNTLICESTYAYRMRSLTRHEHTIRLAERLNTIFNHDSLATCCIRSVGHAAELALTIRACAKAEQIPDVNVWIDSSLVAGVRACERWGCPIFGERVLHLPPGASFKDITGILLLGRTPPQGTGVLHEQESCASNHADCADILNLIARVSPDRVVLIHGTPQAGGVRNVIDEARERFGTHVEIFHSINGQEVQI